MNITEVKAIDDLIKTISFTNSFSVDEEKSGYELTFMPNFNDKVTEFNNSVDSAFFKFISILKKIEPQNQEEYINYFDYKFAKKLVELRLFSGKENGFYSFLKNKHGF